MWYVRVVSTLAPMQSPDGGFGGGHGQLSHCAASYAAILSLIIVGGDDSLKIINRRALCVDVSTMFHVVHDRES